MPYSKKEQTAFLRKYNERIGCINEGLRCINDTLNMNNLIESAGIVVSNMLRFQEESILLRGDVINGCYCFFFSTKYGWVGVGDFKLPTLWIGSIVNPHVNRNIVRIAINEVLIYKKMLGKSPCSYNDELTKRIYTYIDSCINSLYKGQEYEDSMHKLKELRLDVDEIYSD